MVTLTCNCGKVQEMEDYSPGWVRQVRCNFCSACKSECENEEYMEWYQPWDAPEPKPDFVDPNQIKLFE